MTEFTLKPREEDTLKLNIGEESFQIPLISGLTLEEAAGMNDMDSMIGFFRKYIRKEVADKLSMFNWRDIILAWKDASAALIGGNDPGES